MVRSRLYSWPENKIQAYHTSERECLLTSRICHKILPCFLKNSFDLCPQFQRNHLCYHRLLLCLVCWPKISDIPVLGRLTYQRACMVDCKEYAIIQKAKSKFPNISFGGFDDKEDHSLCTAYMHNEIDSLPVKI